MTPSEETQRYMQAVIDITQAYIDKHRQKVMMFNRNGKQLLAKQEQAAIYALEHLVWVIKELMNGVRTPTNGESDAKKV